MMKRPRGSLCGNCRAHYDKMDKRRFVKRNCDIVTRQRFLFTLVERSIRLNQRQSSATRNFVNQQRNVHLAKWCVRRCVCRCLFDKPSRQFNQTYPWEWTFPRGIVVFPKTKRARSQLNDILHYRDERERFGSNFCIRTNHVLWNLRHLFGRVYVSSASIDGNKREAVKWSSKDNYY